MLWMVRYSHRGDLDMSTSDFDMSTSSCSDPLGKHHTLLTDVCLLLLFLLASALPVHTSVLKGRFEVCEGGDIISSIIKPGSHYDYACHIRSLIISSLKLIVDSLDSEKW